MGYVGSTDISTGPHLHFDVYLNNRAINPLSVVKIAKSELSAQTKAELKQKIDAYEEVLQKIQTNPPEEGESGNYIEF